MKIAKRLKRLEKEMNKLVDKRERLERFIQTDTFGMLPSKQRKLLILQEETMYIYSTILSDRIALI